VNGFVKGKALVERPVEGPRLSFLGALMNTPASDRFASIAVMPFSDLSPRKIRSGSVTGLPRKSSTR
jgi:hypothetical protein